MQQPDGSALGVVSATPTPLPSVTATGGVEPFIVTSYVPHVGGDPGPDDGDAVPVMFPLPTMKMLLPTTSKQHAPSTIDNVTVTSVHGIEQVANAKTVSLSSGRTPCCLNVGRSSSLSSNNGFGTS